MAIGSLPGEDDLVLLLRDGLVADALEAIRRGVAGQFAGRAVVSAGPQLEERPQRHARRCLGLRERKRFRIEVHGIEPPVRADAPDRDAVPCAFHRHV